MLQHTGDFCIRLNALHPGILLKAGYLFFPVFNAFTVNGVEFAMRDNSKYTVQQFPFETVHYRQQNNEHKTPQTNPYRGGEGDKRNVAIFLLAAPEARSKLPCQIQPAASP